MKIKKQRTGLKVFICVIFALFIATICYIYTNKYLFDNNGNENIITKKLSEAKVNKLHDKLIIEDTVASLYFDKNVNIDDDAQELISYLITKYAEENNWQGKLEKYMEKNNTTNLSEDDFNKVASVSKKEIEKLLKKEFNVTKTFDIEDEKIYDYRAWNVKYSKENETFYLSALTAGAEIGGLKSRIVNYEREEDVLYIYDKVILCRVSNTFGCINWPLEKEYFITVDDDSKIKNDTKEYSYDKVVNYDYIFEKYADKITTHKTTFKKASDGKYYWQSSEIVK